MLLLKTKGTPEYGTVTAEDIIPKKVPIKNASHTIKKGNGIYRLFIAMEATSPCGLFSMAFFI